MLVCLQVAGWANLNKFKKSIKLKIFHCSLLHRKPTRNVIKSSKSCWSSMAFDESRLTFNMLMWTRDSLHPHELLGRRNTSLKTHWALHIFKWRQADLYVSDLKVQRSSEQIPNDTAKVKNSSSIGRNTARRWISHSHTHTHTHTHTHRNTQEHTGTQTLQVTQEKIERLKYAQAWTAVSTNMLSQAWCTWIREHIVRLAVSTRTVRSLQSTVWGIQLN